MGLAEILEAFSPTAAAMVGAFTAGWLSCEKIQVSPVKARLEKTESRLDALNDKFQAMAMDRLK